MTAQTMFGFGRKKKSGDDGSDTPSADTATALITPADTVETAAKPGLFARLKSRPGKTRSGLTEGIANLVLGESRSMRNCSKTSRPNY